MKYSVTVAFEGSFVVEVEADNEDEAREIAESTPTPHQLAGWCRVGNDFTAVDVEEES